MSKITNSGATGGVLALVLLILLAALVYAAIANRKK
jgi:hypothetical protein